MNKKDIYLDEVFSYRHPKCHRFYNRYTPINQRITIAINLASEIEKFHKDGYALGKLSPTEVAVELDTGKVIIKRIPYHVTGGKENDLLALAVIVFQVLCNGVHPFGGLDTCEPKDFIFGGGKTRKDVPAECPHPKSLPPEILILFNKAFFIGHSNPSERPSASQWHEALTEYYLSLLTCWNRSSKHQYYNALSECPFCECDDLYEEEFKANGGNIITKEAPKIEKPSETVPAPKKSESENEEELPPWERLNAGKALAPTPSVIVTENNKKRNILVGISSIVLVAVCVIVFVLFSGKSGNADESSPNSKIISPTTQLTTSLPSDISLIDTTIGTVMATQTTEPPVLPNWTHDGIITLGEHEYILISFETPVKAMKGFNLTINFSKLGEYANEGDKRWGLFIDGENALNRVGILWIAKANMNIYAPMEFETQEVNRILIEIPTLITSFEYTVELTEVIQG